MSGDIVRCAGVAAYRGNDVLLVRNHLASNNPGFYGVPAGRLNQGESIIEAAIREFQEETGLIAEVNDLIEIPRAWIHPIRGDDGLEKMYKLWVFVTRTFQGELRYTDESIPEWITIEEVTTRPLLPNVEDIVRIGYLCLIS